MQITLDNVGPQTSERFGGTVITPTAPVIVPPATNGINISALTHPLYDQQSANWYKWRAVYESGDKFIEAYVKKFSHRESAEDFLDRKAITPIPAFAKAGVNEIKDSICKRLEDVLRKDGPQSYQDAIDGKLGGVDLKGSTLNWFMNQSVIPELLVMAKVGVFEDNYRLDERETLRSKAGKHPYFYSYRAEDIRSWAYNKSGELQIVLLRDYRYQVDTVTGLPTGEVERFRLLWINDLDGFVHVQFFLQNGAIDGDEITLEIDQIPFHIFEISDSILKDVANHQIALINLESSDISFLLKGNIPFYTEEYDPKDTSGYLKTSQTSYLQQFGPKNADGTPVIPGQAGYITNSDGITVATLGSNPQKAQGTEILAGPTEGRRYPRGSNPPEFIAPPTDSVTASILKQEALKNDIRNLIQLALTNTKASSAPTSARMMDQQSFETGLASIGCELEHGERCLAVIWAKYEKSTQIATIHYPTQYTIKTPEQFQKELDQKMVLREEIPSPTYRKEMNKEIVRLTLGARVPDALLETIVQEIEKSKFYTGSSKAIVADFEAGLVGTATASTTRGWPEGEAKQADLDRAKRVAETIKAQTPGQNPDGQPTGTATSRALNSAARGAPDLSIDPVNAAAVEKVGKPGRGPAAN